MLSTVEKKHKTKNTKPNGFQQKLELLCK